MTINDYQKKCVAQLPKYMYRGDEALLALMSLNGTAGNCIEMYKKTLYEGAELPQEALVKALSQGIFSIAVAAHAFDVDLESIFKKSVEMINESEAKTKSDSGDNNN